MLKFGCDPEVFSVINNEVISPAMLEKFSGLKFLRTDNLDKHPVYIENKDFRWIQDGVAFELNICHPVTTPKEMFDIIKNSVECLEETVSKLNFEGEKLSIYKKPVVGINPEKYFPFLNENKIKQGFIFGCDPDQDAIRPDYHCETVDVISHLFRYGAGHLHTSGAEEFKYLIELAVKYFALTVGNFCISNSPYPEQEKQRATTYGKPGRFRPQTYPDGSFGIEYRTPSNSWISLGLDKYEELFYWAEKAVWLLQNPKFGIEKLENFLSPTVDAIVNADQKLASEILTQI